MPEAPEKSVLESRIIRVIAQTQRLAIDTITIDSTFEQLNIDSLDGINIVFALENEFGVEIPDEGVHSMHSLHDIATAISKLVSEKEPAERAQDAASGAA